MKLFNFAKNRILSAFMNCCWWLPSTAKCVTYSTEPTAISDESEDHAEWGILVPEDSIARRTDPILMTRQERRANVVRMWMEFKGYSREDVEKPLTDERAKEIGVKTWKEYSGDQKSRKAKYIDRFGQDDLMSQRILGDRPSDLDVADDISESIRESAI